MKNLFTILCVLVLSSAYAGEKPPSDDEAESDSCQTDARSYDHGALFYFHSMLCVGNKRFAGMAENIFYHMVVDMGLDVATSSLPADGSSVALTSSRTFRSKTVTGTANLVVSGDARGFFGTYDYHATLSVDAAQFIDLYWSGKGNESKGYLAMIPTALKPGSATGTALLYVKWDRTDSTAQSMQALATRFATSYLATAGTDRAMYYSSSFNDSTKAVSVQAVSIEDKRIATGMLGCYTMYATGTLGAAVTVGKTHSTLTNGHSVGFTDKDVGTGDTALWDNCNATDTKTFTNGSGNLGTVAAFSFNYSCSNVNSAGSGVFASNTVSFTQTKTQVEAMFSVQL